MLDHLDPTTGPFNLSATGPPAGLLNRASERTFKTPSFDRGSALFTT